MHALLCNFRGQHAPGRAVPPGSGGGDRLRIFLQNRQPAAGEAQADNAAIAETMRPKQGERKSFDLQVERVQCSAMAGDKDVPILRQLLKGIQKTSGAAQHGIQAFAALRRRIILRRFKKGRTGRAKRAEIAAFPNAETNLDQAWVQLYFFFGPARDDTCLRIQRQNERRAMLRAQPGLGRARACSAEYRCGPADGTAGCNRSGRGVSGKFQLLAYFLQKYVLWDKYSDILRDKEERSTSVHVSPQPCRRYIGVPDLHP